MGHSKRASQKIFLQGGQFLSTPEVDLEQCQMSDVIDVDIGRPHSDRSAHTSNTLPAERVKAILDVIIRP